MAGTKISALTAATSFLDADELPLNEAGTTKKVTGTLLKAWAGNTLTTVGVPGLAPAAGVRTYIPGSGILVPVGKLRTNTYFEWAFDITKTAAGVAASTYDICFGTTGTTADTARVSFTKPAGTANADVGSISITAISVGPLSGAGIVWGTFRLIHIGGATGLLGHSTHVAEISNANSAGFDVTVAGLIVGVCITTGAADAITIQQITARAYNL